jgi:hypothetical protein
LNFYPLLLEAFVYVSLVYFFIKKRELVVLYLPMFFFVRTLTEVFYVRAIIWYFLVLLIIGFSAFVVNPLRKINPFAVTLFLYFTGLYIFSHSFSETRVYYFTMLCFISIFLIAPNLYRKHGREVILHNLYKMSFFVLLLFLANSLFSTLTGYAPYAIYGRTTGILYGNMGPTEFMLLPVALFVFLLFRSRHPSAFYLVIGFVGFAFVLLSFRRTVGFAAILAVVAFLVLLLLQGNRRQLFSTIGVGAAIVIATLLFTDLGQQFEERYEARFSDRELIEADEGRFTDHEMIYEDLFVHERYSLVFGYGFFNSSGNYGGGARGTRSLHPDIPVIVHASGLLGLGLYFSMVGYGFWQSFRASTTYQDWVVLGFCVAVFSTFTFSGRITEASYAVGIALVLLLPLSNSTYSVNNKNREGALHHGCA